MTEDTRRLTRRQLYDLVWKTPVDILARQFGLSGRGLGKLCERHAIPVPQRGYWARNAAGKKVKRPPLLELSDSFRPEIPLDLTFHLSTNAVGPDEREAGPDPYREMFERQLAEIGTIRVRKQLRDPHSLIAAWISGKDFDRRRARASQFGRGDFRPKCSTPLARRRLRILDVLFRELERRGCKIEESGTRQNALTVRLGRDSFDFTVAEQIRKGRHYFTEEEKAQQGTPQKWMQVRKPTGDLVLTIASALPDAVPQSWQDGTERPLESFLAEILAGFLTCLAHARVRRESREAEELHRRALEEEKRRQEAEREVELARKLGLRQRTEAWRIANQVRAYVATVDKAVSKGEISVEISELEGWSRWALAHADEIDPLKASEALGKDLLWDEEQPSRLGQGCITSGPPLGDPCWFWGRRWWLKR